MRKPASSLANDLHKRLLHLESTRSKIESLFANKTFGRRDAERVYEGLFLSSYVAFEGFINKLFVSLLVKDKGVRSRRSGIVPRVSIGSYKILNELLLGARERKYIDWLPYENTIKMASLYFRGGRPFSELNGEQIIFLQQCRIIRNAIAHKSSFSLKQFEKKILSNQSIPAQEKTPSGYLRGIYRANPNQTRYENLANQIIFISRFLAF